MMRQRNSSCARMSAKKKLSKKVREGFRGYPGAPIAFYGPDGKKATKLVVGIVPCEHAEASQLKKWLSHNDIMREPKVFEEVLAFIKESGAKSVERTGRIIGGPHEEGIDYPEGQSCPQCPFWQGRNRWTGSVEH